MEWTVIMVLVTVAGLGLTVGTPIIKLNQNITTLTVTLNHLREELVEQKKALEEQKKSSRTSHEKLWIHNNEQDKILADHESRISLLEGVSKK